MKSFVPHAEIERFVRNCDRYFRVGNLTDWRTLLRADNSASMRSFSCISSGIDNLDRSRGVAPDTGPEATVGA